VRQSARGRRVPIGDDADIEFRLLGSLEAVRGGEQRALLERAYPALATVD
jgi:hypothetical protein